MAGGYLQLGWEQTPTQVLTRWKPFIFGGLKSRRSIRNTGSAAGGEVLESRIHRVLSSIPAVLFERDVPCSLYLLLQEKGFDSLGLGWCFPYFHKFSCTRMWVLTSVHTWGREIVGLTMLQVFLFSQSLFANVYLHDTRVIFKMKWYEILTSTIFTQSGLFLLSRPCRNCSKSLGSDKSGLYL